MMASKEALKVVVFLGTVRENNMGSRAAKFLLQRLKDRGFSTTLLDADAMDLPMLKKPLHFYQDRSQAPQILQDTNKVIEAADAFVVITAEYNHSMPPGLTNLMDHFPIASYKYRPSGIVCYSMGSFAGVRAATQARNLLGELGTPSISNIFAIPQINKTFNDDGVPADADRMNKNSDKFISELEWYASALKKQLETVGRPL